MHRIKRAYKALALIVLNTLVLLVLVELFSTGILAVVSIPAVKTRIDQLTGQPLTLAVHYNSLPYYAQQTWSAQYWEEFSLIRDKEYHPYVIWRNPPFHGDTLNIDRNGMRLTPESDCVPGSYKVFLFGGSAMWGWGAPDWGTIPAYLQKQLEKVRNEPVCVVNYAENAYVSTQNLIQLMLELQAGNIPDSVIFYDGVNEVFTTTQPGGPSAHLQLSEISDRFEAPRSSLLLWLLQRNSIQLMSRLTSYFLPPLDPTPEDSVNENNIANAIIGTYLANLEMARSLSKTFGFDLYFLWQPYILVGNKVLTTEEESLIEDFSWQQRLDARLQNRFDLVYKRVEGSAQEHEDLYYLGNVFDEVDSQIWIDTWGHVTPDGNLIVADKILEIMEDRQIDNSKE